MPNDAYISTGCAQLWETAGVRVDATHNRLVRGEAQRDIEPRVMDVLLVLMQHHGEVVSRDRLIEKVWQGRPISDEAINRAVFEIRKAFSDLGVEIDVIRTVRSRGYEWIPDALAREGAAGSWVRTPSKLGLAALLAVVAAVVVLVWQSFDAAGPVEAPIPPVELPSPSSPVIQLVEPVSEWSVDMRDTYGVALLGRIERLLSHQNNLVVRSHEAAADEEAFRLELTLDAEGGTDRIGARLVAPASEQPVWADSLLLENGIPGADEAPERLVAGLMRALRLDYTPYEACPLPSDPSALQDYFEARRLLALRGEDNIRSAISTLQRVLDRQPEFSQAWSVLARAYEVLPAYIDGDAGLQERATTASLAEASARKALEICATDALAFQIAGTVPGYRGSNPWILAEYRMRHALALDPNDGELARAYSEHLLYLGMFAEAYRVRKHAFRVAPDNPRIALELAWMERELGDLERSAALLEHARSQGSMIIWPIMEHAQATEEKDWATVEELLPHYPDVMQPAMRAVYEVDRNPGDEAAVDRAERVLRGIMAENPDVGNMLAHVMGISIGRFDLAFEAYEVMRRDQYNYTSFWSKRSAAFRRDPRFADAVFEMGMREYWERFGAPDFCDLTDDGLDCHS